MREWTLEIRMRGISTVAGVALPFTFNYRLPLSPRPWTRMLFALEPDLIEVGDVFHPAWCAAQARRLCRWWWAGSRRRFTGCAAGW